MPDPVAESIAFLKRRIEQDQTALSQLEALPAARSNGHSNGSRTPSSCSFDSPCPDASEPSQCRGIHAQR